MRLSIASVGRVAVASLGLWLFQAIGHVQACDEVWFTATAEQDGRTVIFRARKEAPCGIDTEDYPYYVSVFWPYKPANDGGMPDGDTNADHIVFEDTLIPLDLEGYSQLMLVITGNGSKEWIWYVRDFDDWIGRLNAALSGHPVYPIDIEYQLDPEWSIHQGFIDWIPGTEQLP